MIFRPDHGYKKLLVIPQGYRIIIMVNLRNVDRFSEGLSQSFSLPDGVVGNSLMGPQDIPFPIDEIASGCFQTFLL